MDGKQDVWASSLSQVVGFASNRAIVEVEVTVGERWRILVVMKNDRRLGWYRLGVSISNVDIINDRVNKSTLVELVVTIGKFLDGNTDIVSWVIGPQFQGQTWRYHEWP